MTLIIRVAAAALSLCSSISWGVDNAIKDLETTSKCGGSILKVIVRMDRSPPGSTKNDWIRWGEESHIGVPVASTEIVWDNKPVITRASAFADLRDVRSLSIDSKSKGCSFVLIGGDAASSYKAHYFLQSGVLTRRLVRSGEFPQDSWEDTHYRINTGGDD